MNGTTIKTMVAQKKMERKAKRLAVLRVGLSKISKKRDKLNLKELLLPFEIKVAKVKESLQIKIKEM